MSAGLRVRLRSNPRLRYVASVLLVAFVYWLVGAAVQPLNQGTTRGVFAVWSPVGVGLAMLLIFGVRVWPGILVGALTLVVLRPLPSHDLLGAIGALTVVPIGQTIGQVTGWWLLRTRGFDRSLNRVRDVRAFALYGMLLAPALSNSLVLAGLWCTGVARPEVIPGVWLAVWMSDVRSVLIVGPLLMVWQAHRQTVGTRASRLAEAAALFGSLGLASGVLFGIWHVDTLGIVGTPYVLFPWLVWAAVRFGPRGTVSVNALVAAIAVWAMRSGTSPLVAAGLASDFSDLMTMTYLAVTAMTMLFLAAAMHEKQEAAAEIERLKAQAALRAQDARFRALVQSAADVIMVLDAHMHLRYVSPAATQAWGVAPGECEGERFMARVHPDDVVAARHLLSTAIEQAGATTTTELRMLHADHSWRRFELVATNLLDDPAVAGIVITCHDVTERRAFEQQLTDLAFQDALTELPNRPLFMDRLERALARAERQSSSVAVLLVDLDNFKLVNDGLGHQAGDRMLVEVAARLRETLRAQDTAARLGGDEFALLLEDLSTPNDAAEVARRVVARLQMPIGVGAAAGGRDIVISSSIGVALSTPHCAPDALLRNADLALGRAKAHGKGTCAVFDSTLETHALDRLELQADLPGAVERGELRVLYQPILKLSDGSLAEVEALVRWQHPLRGLISPLAFIPLAEETGAIVQIGEWVLEQACRQAQAWRLEFPEAPALVMSVNLSARQLQYDGLVAEVARVLQETGLEPRFLKLEITESVLVRDIDATLATLRALKQLGISIAIDDFGTGYSSLSYLKRLPVDTLKIDRSFVDGLGQDPQDSAIVRSVVSLAKTLSLTVTGEGVETSAQEAELQALGCDRGQGYLYARPIAADAIARLLGAVQDDDGALRAA